MTQDFVADIDGLITRFSTEDEFSRRWFYPRYEAGALHEPFATRRFIAQARRASLIVDIGANLGWFSCIAAMANPSAEVIAFEMDPDNAELCRRNIALNRLKNVELIQSSVSATSGIVRYDKKAGAAAGLRISETGNAEVTSINLDTFFARRTPPDLMKIDVEGAELLVLEGMETLLQNNAPLSILLEVHRSKLLDLGGNVARVFEFLRQSGFVFQILNHRHSKLDVYDPEQWLETGGENALLVAQKKKRGSPQGDD